MTWHPKARSCAPQPTIFLSVVSICYPFFLFFIKKRRRKKKAFPSAGGQRGHLHQLVTKSKSQHLPYPTYLTIPKLSSMIPRLTTPETHDYLGDDNEGLTRPAGQVR